MAGIFHSLGRILPRPLYWKLLDSLAAFEDKNFNHPTPPTLQPKHLEGAKLLPTRYDLLDVLPKGGTIAELGVDQGDFSREILDRCQPRHLALVDWWSTARYGEDKKKAVFARFQKQLQDGSMSITLGNSVEVAKEFDDARFDCVYIDTSHNYPVTKAELLAYAPKVKPGGFLAGHDYVIGNWRGRIRYGVIEAVHEFCVEHNWRIVYLTMECPDHPSFAIQRIP